MKHAKLLSAVMAIFSLLLALGIPRSVAHAVNLAQASSRQPAGALQNPPTDQIIVKYKSATGLNLATAANQATPMAALSGAAGVQLNYYRAMSGEAHVLKLPSNLPEDQVRTIAERIAALPNVEYAEPDRITSIALTPTDPQYVNQWHFSGTYGIKAPEAWDVTTGSNAIIVAVLDTGILFGHPDLAGRILAGYDFVSNVDRANDGNGRDNDASDPGDWVTTLERTTPGGPFSGCEVGNSSWHGTAVAGHIGAATDNNTDVAGIDWHARLLPIRVLGKCGNNNDSDIADGIRWAAGVSVNNIPNNPTPARVLNLSLGRNGACGDTYQSAIDAARGQGAVVVVAAGNSGQDANNTAPGNCKGVITVAATDWSGYRSVWNPTQSSNFGGTVEISAPGSAGITTSNTGTQGPGTNTFGGFGGTSMATPHVAGTVSLLLSVRPELTPDQVLQQLQYSVSGFPTNSTCTTAICGSGIVNAFETVTGLYVNKGYVGGLGLPEQPYGTFGDAYNRAWPGARIKLRAETYAAPQVINKRVTLVATNGTVVIGR